MSADRTQHDPTDGQVPAGADPVEQRLRGDSPGDSDGAAPSEGGPQVPADDLFPLVTEELRIPSAILLRQIRQIRHAIDEAGPPRSRRALASIDEQARRLAELARSMRELELLSRGGVQLKRRLVDIDTLLDEVVLARAPAARARGILVERADRAETALVEGDPERMARAVDAAMDAMWGALDRGDALRLTAHRNAQGARILLETRHVRQGRGRRRRRAPRLSGAAFAIARKLCELHGGALDLVRDGEEVSAWMDFPASAASAQPQPREVPAEGKACLLVVDDDPDTREALSMMLGDDYDVRLAADGREALERAAAEHPDIVLMDLYMPRMDGLAALEAMRTDPATEDVPVILVSARGDELTRSRSLDLGAVDFLQKPFSGRELKARIERTLRLTRRESELQTLASTDPLTGLANLRAFRARLDEEVKRARRYHTPLSCVMVDMDNLKPINDQLGHAAGDHAIRAVAAVLGRELRETDFGARYGGDEFVLLLPHTSGAEARVFAERACGRLAESPLQLGERTVRLAASFGISALGDEPMEDAGDLLVRRADAALYSAKRAGRGRVAAHPSANAGQPAPLL